MTQLFEYASVREAFSLLVQGTTEVRILEAATQGSRQPRTHIGYFDAADQLVGELGKFTSWTGCYFTLNQIDPRIASRSRNTFTTKSVGTKDSEIIRRRFLLVDIDECRPAGIPTSDPEHDRAIERAREIKAWLLAQGLPEPVLCDSGNGSHLLLPVDLPAESDLPARVLEALAARFNDDPEGKRGLKVDRSVINPARICKLPGTLTCKGDGSDTERPWRVAKILDKPEFLLSASAETLEQIASKPIAPRETSPSSTTIFRATSGPVDVERWLRENGLEGTVRGPDNWQSSAGAGKKWIFLESPLCDHGGDGPWIGEKGNGFPSAGCHHDSCSWSWDDLAKRFPRGIEEDRPPEYLPGLPAPTKAKPKRKAISEVRLSEVEPETVRWLWKHRLARGKLTLLAGDPGVSKSLVSLDLAAKVTTGQGFPDDPGEQRKPEGVIIMSSEDGLRDTITPRFLAAGGDPSRAVFLGHVEGEDLLGEPAQTWFNLRKDLPALREALERHPETALLVIDVIAGYLGDVDSHNDAAMRGVLGPLASLAEERSVCILGLAHLNKDSSQKSVHRIVGSIAFTGQSRFVLGVIREKPDAEETIESDGVFRDTESSRILVTIKSNLGPDRLAQRYRIASSEASEDVPVLHWDPEVFLLDLDQAADKERKGPVERDRAKEFLERLLRPGDLPQPEIMARGSREGFTEITLRRAKTALGVASRKIGTGWFWSLPQEEASQALDSEADQLEDDHPSPLPPCSDHVDHLPTNGVSQVNDHPPP